MTRPVLQQISLDNSDRLLVRSTGVDANPARDSKALQMIQSKVSDRS